MPLHGKNVTVKDLLCRGHGGNGLNFYAASLYYMNSQSEFASIIIEDGHNRSFIRTMHVYITVLAERKTALLFSKTCQLS